VLIVGVSLAAGLGMAGVAYAVSSGGYSPAQQDCPKNADANNAGQPGAQQSQAAVPGCHNLKLNVEDSQGHRYVQVGSDQIPNGSNQPPHTLEASVDANGATPGRDTGACAKHSSGAAARVDLTNPSPATVAPCTATPGPSIAGVPLSGFSVSFGADDNLDSGEHDGVTGAKGSHKSVNGPSDGGAAVVNWHPAEVGPWIDAVLRADTAALLTNPFPIADAGTGACADGFCFSVQTRRRTVYQGGNKREPSRDVYDYSAKQWDPYGCNSGAPQSQSAAACGGHSMDWWRRQEAQNVYAEPGLQVYEDPDPQASPIDPLYESGVTSKPTDYPIPAVYAGTCGVTAGGGALTAPAGLPGVNRAGQVSVSTGC
jgi:hypothetical protein